MDMQEIVALVGDPTRNPEYAGAVNKGRVFKRDQVANARSVIAICEIEHTAGSDGIYGDDPKWKILSHDFDPNSYRLMLDALRKIPYKTVDGALRFGYMYSEKHPNRLVYERYTEERQQKSLIHFCNDCKTVHPEPYMVHDAVWLTVVESPQQKMILCLTCIQKRLGRDLNIQDFTDYPINDGIRFGFNLYRRTGNL